MELRSIMMRLAPDQRVMLTNYASGDVIDTGTAHEITNSAWYTELYRTSTVHCIGATVTEGYLVIAIMDPEHPEHPEEKEE